jgi:phenylpropionate dioxygenase-like ring-hydroxylating dioxygenase large terminal subunit
MVIFRTREGEVHVLDAYCPHLGAHLGEGGRVMGETIRCPFHGWQFGGDGVCSNIPYSKKDPPAKARVKSWPVLERNGFVFVWHHHEEAAPTWEIPQLPEFADPRWTEPRQFELKVPVHIQDMAENNCDPVHFRYVHGNVHGIESEVQPGDTDRPYYFRALSRSTQDTPLGSFETELERNTWGLGLVSVGINGIGDAGLLMLAATSPIDHHNTHSRWLFTVTADMADLAGEDFIDQMSKGVLQDMRIWENKIHRAAPVLCDADTELAFFRKWVRQFYPGNEPKKTARIAGGARVSA